MVVYLEKAQDRRKSYAARVDILTGLLLRAQGGRRNADFRVYKQTNRRNSHLVQDLIPLPSKYIHMCTLYAHTNAYMPRFGPSGFLGPSRCLIPPPGRFLGSQPSTPYVQCVCVCIHTHTPTYTPTRVKNRNDADNTPFSALVKNNPPRQATSALID